MASGLRVLHLAVASVIEMMTAYSRSDAEEFNRAVRAYDGLLRDDAWHDASDGHRGAVQPCRLFAGTAGVYVSRLCCWGCGCCSGSDRLGGRGPATIAGALCVFRR